MTVYEYRKKHPDCGYCHHRNPPFDYCSATNKRTSKKTAKKCPCYVPEKWDYEVEGRYDEHANDRKGGE